MRLRTPANHRELLTVPEFPVVPRLVEHNRKQLASTAIRIDGIPLAEFRRQVRIELLGSEHPEPLVVTGHQPELFHPGVWVKNFAAHGLATRLGGLAVNLIVDSDAVKCATIAMPTWTHWEPHAIRIALIPWAESPAEQSWETFHVHNEALFRSVAEQIAEQSQLWGYEPIANAAWSTMHGAKYENRLTAARVSMEHRWGIRNVEIRTSTIGRSSMFHHFVKHLMTDQDRFCEVHNAAVRAYRRDHGLRSRTHPVPELQDGEAPFWHVTDRGREKVSRSFDPQRIRPRALTLTLFARLCFADWFIHGIGGGKYDAVTDTILRQYFGIEPPGFQVVSATLHLPLPVFPATQDDLAKKRRLFRDLYWNPQRYLPDTEPDHAALRTLAVGRNQYRAFRELGERLRPQLQARIDEVKSELERMESECSANERLRRRDLAWVLYPESLLGPYLQDVRDRAYGG